jgi:putative transcriptional regulator
MIREHIDTVDALMAYYVAGALPKPVRVLVEAHMEMRDTNRSYLRDLEILAGNALERLEPQPLSDRQHCLDAIFASPGFPDTPMVTRTREKSSIIPEAIFNYVGLEENEIPWRTKLPGFKEFVFGNLDGCEVSFFWLRPGRAVPAHTHKGVEIFLVLDGAFNDRRGRFARGDISVADDTVDHRPVAEKDRPCIGFSVVDQPLKLTGSLTQLIGDLIG